ncbi:small ribosomal subunit protein mS31-like [Lineus longissimus]|uniref:small ribosomal subunit protein mS31-like n=1 Tax=Lineus longissimus TaxID=88925 RepID=UPI00315CDA7F
MAASLKHVFRFSAKLSKCGILRVPHLSGRRVAICRTLSSDSKDPDTGSKAKLDLAKPKNRRKEIDERKVEADRAKEIGLDHKLVKAAESVAESLGGDVKQTQSDLLQQLKVHATKAVEEEPEQVQKKSAQSMSMGDLLSSMKFERTTSRRRGAPSKPRAKDSSSSSDDDDTPRKRDRFPNTIAQREFQQSSFREERVKSMEEIFKGNRLNIFNTNDDLEVEKKTVAEPPSNPLFDEADAAEFLRLSSAPPANAFEEMIQWTKEGKLWHFPIDNEQGWDEEKKVGFHEHVFLDNLLADFPQTPSIQHFMELVATGLSMNPYLTVEMKKEHINWFKEYITSKMHLIEDDTDKAAQESLS